MRDFRFWRWRREQDGDIERELDAHLDLAVEERLVAGREPREARLDARREFGNRLLTTRRRSGGNGPARPWSG